MNSSARAPKNMWDSVFHFFKWEGVITDNACRHLWCCFPRDPFNTGPALISGLWQSKVQITWYLKLVKLPRDRGLRRGSSLKCYTDNAVTHWANQHRPCSDPWMAEDLWFGGGRNWKLALYSINAQHLCPSERTCYSSLPWYNFTINPPPLSVYFIFLFPSHVWGIVFPYEFRVIMVTTQFDYKK